MNQRGPPIHDVHKEFSSHLATAHPYFVEALHVSTRPCGFLWGFPLRIKLGEPMYLILCVLVESYIVSLNYNFYYNFILFFNVLFDGFLWVLFPILCQVWSSSCFGKYGIFGFPSLNELGFSRVSLFGGGGRRVLVLDCPFCNFLNDL